jgi:translocation and assembly module TamB
MDPFVIASHSLVLRRAGSELWLDGRTATGYYGQDDALDLRVRLEDWPAADLTKALRLDINLAGPASGEAAYKGRRSALVGSAHLKVPSGTYYGIAFTDLEVRTRSRAGSTEVTTGRARVGGGEVAFRGTVSDEGFYDGRAEAEGVDVGAVLPALPGGVRAGGKVSGRATLAGTLVRPRLSASLRSARLFVGDEGLGALEARLSGRGDGRVGIEAECRSPRVRLRLAGEVQAAPPYLAALSLRARDTSLDPFLRASFPALPSVVGIVATGEVELRGPLAEPGRLQASASASELDVLLPDYPVRNRGAVRLGLEEGRIDLEALHLAGEGTDLVVSGSAGLLAHASLGITARGAADLRALQVVTPALRGRGAARLALDVSGTTASPRVEGTLSLEGGGIRVRGFPQGLEEAHGTVRFSESAADFSGVSASFGGGTVELEGQAAYGGGRLRSFDVRATGRSLGLRYPEGLRSTIDADLRFFGDAANQWIAGEVEVRQALWTRRYDLASELLGAGRAAEPALGFGETVHFDLKLRAPGTFRIDNNLAALQARADLAVRGTGAAPLVVGRAEVEGGRVYFQGQTYLIRRGAMEFANPQRIDPFFDLEAETRIRSYRITLRVTGTLERITPTLTSDPPLSALQILNLLAGREEVTSLAQVQSQTQQTQLAATGAATLAAGRLAEEIGLEREAERLFGLNRFSIDPSLVRGSATTPVARVTLGKRITSDLNVLYAQDLSGTSQDRVVSVEYTLSDRFSLLLTWSDLDGLGGDILLRQSR